MVEQYFNGKLKEVKRRRKLTRAFSNQEWEIIDKIKSLTTFHNIDNISRTKAYFTFFKMNEEIPWSFLASMVSRNAGWNMTDLEGKWFPYGLDKNLREQLFMTYERANWLIFLDAFPQLLVYEQSKKLNKPLFYLLPAFSVSIFAEVEWELFWEKFDRQRLMTSQIINEQNVIQKPVIENHFYKQKVFSSLAYKLQDWLHFSSVVFPTRKGELYGFSAHDFQSLDQRIELGKKLAWLLFNKQYFRDFYLFSYKTEHTGSRYDYEQYFSMKKQRDTPYLRTTFPIYNHHRKDDDDWFTLRKVKRKWYKPTKPDGRYNLSDWYRQKQHQLHIGISLEQWFKLKI